MAAGDIESALLTIRKPRKRGPRMKSGARKWLETYEHKIAMEMAALAADGKTFSWSSLSDWMFEHTNIRTMEGTKVLPGMLAQAWTRIKAARNMSKINMERQSTGYRHGAATIGVARPIGEGLELTTLGKKK